MQTESEAAISWGAPEFNSKKYLDKNNFFYNIQLLSV